MRTPRIFYQGQLKDVLEIRLNEETSHYLIRVLRLNENQPIIVFNSSINPPFYEYQGQIKTIDYIKKNRPIVSIQLLHEKHVYTESSLNLTLIQAICKNDSMDWIIQKAVELGVTKIFPVYTEYGNIKFDIDKGLKKTAHWQKIAISACEQCERVYVPTIMHPEPLTHYLQQPFEGQSFLLHPRTGKNFEKGLLHINNINIPFRFIIGPEGGLSEKELILLDGHNFKTLSLGPRILRTETAAISALTLLQFMKGDIGGN